MAASSLNPDIPSNINPTPQLVKSASVTPLLSVAISPETTGDPTLEFEAVVSNIIADTQGFRERSYQICKRGIDVMGSIVLLTISLPLCIATAIAIKLNSPGPVLFRQARLTKNGRIFSCLKFRSMVEDAETRLRCDPQLQFAFQENYKIKEDPRVDRLGALLRRSSLDELPQLWNVIKGDMSLIGPRPIVPDELGKYDSDAAKLLSVKAGVSGLWQTCGRSDTTYAQRVRFDMIYIDNRSTWLDFKLLLLTVVAVCRKVGAC